ncbi:MAG: hypothetical protein IJD89_07400, partial [Clostridia bacterium]|nr:hypothetical protein [Clostridia bacterium]
MEPFVQVAFDVNVPAAFPATFSTVTLTEEIATSDATSPKRYPRETEFLLPTRYKKLPVNLLVNLSTLLTVKLYSATLQTTSSLIT